MTGGGSLVDGFDKLIEARTGIHTMVAEDAVLHVVEGVEALARTLGDAADGVLGDHRVDALSLIHI